MRVKTLLSVAVLSVGTMLAGGCSPDAVSPLAPTAAAPPLLSTTGALLGTTTSLVGGVVGGVTSVVGDVVSTLLPVVVRTKGLAQDVVVTQTISPSGGVIKVPEAGLTITFAPGAVSE